MWSRLKEWEGEWAAESSAEGQCLKWVLVPHPYHEGKPVLVWRHNLFLLWQNTHNIKCIILIIFHCMTQWHSINSPCCTTISTIYFQNVSIIPNGNSVAINQYLPTPLFTQSLVTFILLSVLWIALPGTSYKYHAIFVFCPDLFHLAYFQGSSMFGI